MKIYNVLDYGIVNDGKTLNSVALQKLIDYCFCQGGGKLVFSKGEYVLSTVFLKSNVHIVLEKDAVILGAESFYDYAPEEKVDYPLYQDSSHSFFHCSLIVGIGCENVSITGEGKIDMRSIWDEDNVRKIKHRGPKCIALKECNNVVISGIGIYNATDLAVYFAGCKDVEICNLNLRVYIDGISPDNSSNVRIHDCAIETGDDGIVFKSSYTLNKIGVCEDIEVYNCKVKSRCNAVKFGTESNGGFKNINIQNIDIYETRISGIAIESVDGAIIDNINIKNITMRNVNALIFIHLGERMRGPENLEVGEIRNITIENLTAEGPYVPYDVIAWDYYAFIKKDFNQDPKKYFPQAGVEGVVGKDVFQITSNICGLKNKPLKNIKLRNIRLLLEGGVEGFNEYVPEGAKDYPEAYVYGWILPAKGIYFRHIDGLILEDIVVKTYREDARKDFVFENVKGNIQ